MTHLAAHFPCRSALLPHFPPSAKSTVHPLIFSSSFLLLHPLPTSFLTGTIPGLLLLLLPVLPRGADSTAQWGVASTSREGGTDFLYQHLSRPSVLDSSTLSPPEWGYYSETKTPSINPCALLHPDPFGQDKLKRWFFYPVDGTNGVCAASFICHCGFILI